VPKTAALKSFWDYAFHKEWLKGGDLNLCDEFLVFALGGLLWLRRFDERNFGFPIHLIECSEFFPSFPICCHFDFSFHAGASGGGCFLNQAGGSAGLPAVRMAAKFFGEYLPFTEREGSDLENKWEQDRAFL
jgi:hypothetical protein